MFILRQKLGAYNVFLILKAAFSLFSTIVYTTYMVYRVVEVGLNPLQLMLLGAVMEITSMVFQIPTGLLADIYSRKLSVIIGIMLMGGAFIIEGLCPFFAAILLAQIPWAIGFTFWSGALEAWIADETANEKDISQVFLRGSQIGLVGSIIGVPISVALASIHLNIPIVIGGFLFLVLGLFLIIAMPEQRFNHKTHEQENRWLIMRNTLQQSWHLVRLRPILLTILCITIFFGLSSEGFDRLWTAHFINDFVFPTFGNFSQIEWFGAISIVSTLLSLISTEIVRKYVHLEKHSSAAYTLSLITSLMIISIITFGLAGNFFLALLAYLVASSLRQIISPIYTAWLSQNIDSQVRATILSACSQLDTIGQIVGGPVVGVIGTLASLRIAMVVIGGLLGPALPMFFMTIHQDRVEQVAQQDTSLLIDNPESVS